MIVVDASVAAKWLLPEAGEDQAQRLLGGDQQLAAPASIRVEVACAILQQHRVGKLRENDARPLCQFWENLIDARLHILAVDELFDSAREFAFELKHTLPDCFYLAAGKRLECPVVTADGAFFEAGKTANNIILLANLATEQPPSSLP